MSVSSSRVVVGAGLLAGLMAGLLPGPAAALPPDFRIEPVGTGWGQVTGIAFTPEGHGFVWEKAGRVWRVENGQRSAQPLIDISEEVGDWRDLGMLGFAADPDFTTNGRFYLLYVVDYHHLSEFGTPEYNAQANEYFHDTISRLTRYTCDPADADAAADPASRTVLVGATMQTGFPMCFQSHAIGSLAFGADGTLLAGCGDGASYDAVDNGGYRFGSSFTALADGIITPKEDVGAFRAQLVDSLAGKVIRIDPETGAGVPSNPFYDGADPAAPRSKVWALGFRNPFRWSIRPGSGSADPAAGDPGTLYIGDVGWSTAEELNIARTGGLNFGWPLYEGTRPSPGYQAISAFNLDAPNPLVGVGGCTQGHLQFRDLLVQATLATPSWPNPCDPAQQVPAGLPRFVHTRPVIEWRETRPPRVPTFTGTAASDIDMGAPGCPVSGYSGFGGYSSVGGVWYSGANGNYPALYRNTYFHGDYAGFWIHNFGFDAADNLMEVREFQSGSTPVVSIAENPADGDLYYVAYSYFSGVGQVYRVRYSVEAPPVAVAGADIRFGPSPLAVQFSSAGSMDANGPVYFEWDFGDGTAPVSDADPAHVFEPYIDITAQGTIIARVLELSPPGPLGSGSPDPEVIRDGVRPPAGSTDPLGQFDTFHNGDQGTVDWIGYTFPAARRINRVEFQEGMEFPAGGWFTTLRVEARIGGGWTTVADLSWPDYAGLNQIGYEGVTFTFPAVLADGVRIIGRPGGAGKFISVGELRAFAEPEPGETVPPRRHDVRLVVRDSEMQAAAATLAVWTDNTPPTVVVTEPVDGSTFCVAGPTAIPLGAVVGDAEHGAGGGPGGVACAWQSVLHHNTHTHPEPPEPGCQGQAVIEGHGAAGDTFYFELILTATDPLGLATVRSVSIFQACCPADFNHAGGVTVQDIFDFLAAYFSNDEHADFNGTGGITVQDIFDFLAAYFAPCP